MKAQVTAVRPVLKRPAEWQYQFKRNDKGRLVGRCKLRTHCTWKPWRRACVSCYTKCKVFRRASDSVCGLHTPAASYDGELSRDERQYQALLQLQAWATDTRLRAAHAVNQEHERVGRGYRDYCRLAKRKYDELRQAWDQAREDLRREQSSRLALEACALAVVRRAQADEGAQPAAAWHERAVAAEARLAQLEQEWVAAQTKLHEAVQQGGQARDRLARAEAACARAQKEASAAAAATAQAQQQSESWRRRAQSAEEALRQVQLMQQQAWWWSLPPKLPPLVPAASSGAPASKLDEVSG